MRERKTENLLAIDQPFLSKLLQMFVVESVRDWDVYVIPPVVSSLVAPDQQDGRTPRVKRIQGSKRSSIVLRAQFTHVIVF
jgi:hypothetical protein